MDVQKENVDPPPSESQSSGKIRKGFKLFGKRKPGNIFSIRSKGDGNNKSPVIRSSTTDGLSETAAPDSEQEPDSEKGKDVSQGEREQAEEEPLGEDGVMAAATAPRASISSVSSAKSLSFLSLLRGGRRGTGDRRVHTMSQPAGRQRRGLKGLFGNVKFRSKDKEEEAPPSPLLMSSRANSVEIIKDDLTLTPKSQPRAPDSPETESYEPDKSLKAQDSTATSPSETVTPQVTAGNVSRTNEHVPPSPTSEPPLVPGDNSLSCLLADISSLLTFDSITGGGDIMADVEAEWGKASSPVSAPGTEFTPSSTSLFSKPTVSFPLTSVPAATSKPSPVASHITSSTQSSTPPTKTTSTSSPIIKPNSIITTLTKSSPLMTHSVKLSSDSMPASESPASITIKTTPMHIATKPSTIPVTLTSLSAPVMSPPLMTTNSTLSSTSATTTAPLNTPATIVKAPSISPTPTCTASQLASEITASPQSLASVSKPIPYAAPVPAKLPPATHSPPTPVAFTQIQPAKLDLTGSLSLKTSTSTSSAAGDSKAPVIVSAACAVTTKPPSPTPVTPPSGSVSAALSQPALTSSPMGLNKTPPSLVSVPDIYPSSTPSATTTTQPSSASVPTSAPFIPLTTKPTTVPASSDKMPSAPTSTPTPTTPAVAASPAPPPPVQMQASHSKPPPVPAQIPISVFKDLPAPVCIQVSVAKDSPAQIQVSQSKALPAPTPVICPITSPPSTPAAGPSEAPVSAKMRGSGQASVDGQLTSPSSIGVQSKTELHSESRTSLQGPPRESRIPQVKASGLSKIPVVGGGRAGRLPVRDNQHADDEASRDPPTPVLEEERPHFNSHAGSKDKIIDVEANVPTSKHTQEESQQLPQPKVLTSLPRDSKIPVKHGAPPHTASQIPQAKEPSRTKIPVSKVPVRRAGTKPAAAQIRK